MNEALGIKSPHLTRSVSGVGHLIMFLRPTAFTTLRLFEMPVVTKDKTDLNENLLTPIEICQSVFTKKHLYCAAIKAFLFFHLTFDDVSM
jgi:hypothetical protein